MAYKLTLEAVKAAAREAYLAGGLGFQTGESKCEYVGRETSAPCAVGAALPTYVASQLGRGGLNGQTVGALVREGHLEVPEGELGSIERIQSAHDILVNAQRDSFYSPAMTAKRERDFCALLDIPEEG